MLPIQSMQNQYFSSCFLSCFLTFRLIGSSIWIRLKYKVERGYLWPVFLAVFLSPWQLQAASTPHGEISLRVADQTREVREQAFQRGLAAMFVRVSGDRRVMNELRRPKTRLYVQQFSYEPLQTVTFDSAGEMLTQRIKIRYNIDQIEKHLRENGLLESVEESETQSTAHIEIEAVDSMTKHNRVENYLTQLSSVKMVNHLQTNGEKALFEIVLRSSDAVFLSSIDNDGKLLKVIAEKGVEQVAALQAEGSQKVSNTTILEAKNNTKSFPAALSDRQVEQTPVYHYRLVR